MCLELFDLHLPNPDRVTADLDVAQRRYLRGEGDGLIRGRPHRPDVIAGKPKLAWSYEVPPNQPGSGVSRSNVIWNSRRY